MRVSFRKIRLYTLLAILAGVAFWGVESWRADHFTFAWDKPLRILVIAATDPRSNASGEVEAATIRRFLTGETATNANLKGVERWIEREHERLTGRHGPPLELIAEGPFPAGGEVPILPGDEASFLTRWRATSRFLEFFERVAREQKLVTRAYDAVLFVLFYDDEDPGRMREQRSVAARRTRRGMVFTALDRDHMERACVLLAHELFHTLGASDKYDGNQSLHPGGFADPDQRPLYPQENAEIMALGIPISPIAEERVESLNECVVGAATAAEIGWSAPELSTPPNPQ